MTTTFLLGYFLGISTYSLITQIINHKDERPDLGGFGGRNRNSTIPHYRESRGSVERN